MRPRTALALVALLLGAVGVGVVVLTDDAGGSLTVEWVSDTERPNQVNHHAAVATRVDGEAYVVAPVSTVEPDRADCALVALDGNGSVRWRHAIPDSACAIHGIGDPALLDFDGDGDLEAVAPTTAEELLVVDLQTGRLEHRFPLTSYGFSQPALVTDPDRRTVVADFYGTVFALRPNGTEAWNRSLDTVVVADVVVGDFAGDSRPEIAVGGSRRVVLLTPAGERVWSRNVSTQYLVPTSVEGDPVLVAAKGKTVTALSGDGSTLWQASPGNRPAVHGIADGDGDGTPEVYVGVRGDVVALDASSGAVEWRTTLAPDTLMPAPSVGDVDGDGRPDVVAVTNDGTVSVLDPESGDVRAAYSRDVEVWVHPTVTDYDGDGRDEILVTYGDGRVVALSFAAASK